MSENIATTPARPTRARIEDLHLRMVAAHERLHQLALEAGRIAPPPLTCWERLLLDGSGA
ncbi:MAG: hypothetical protein ACHREM_07760 [Polyangiales bacterium]